MCYASPGPRCTSHALKTLTRARAQWDNAKTVPERHAAMAALKEAERQYDATPGGQQTLRAMIQADGDADGMLSARLDYAVQRRRSMLAAIHSTDKGDITSSHVVEDEHVPSGTRRRFAAMASASTVPVATIPTQTPHGRADDAEVLPDLDDPDPQQLQAEEDLLGEDFTKWFDEMTRDD